MVKTFRKFSLISRRQNCVFNSESGPESLQNIFTLSQRKHSKFLRENNVSLSGQTHVSAIWHLDPFLTHSFSLSFSQDSNRMFESEGRPTNKTRSQCQVLSLCLLCPHLLLFYTSWHKFPQFSQFSQDYLDLPVIGGDSASENDSDEKSDIVEGDSLWSGDQCYYY